MNTKFMSELVAPCSERTDTSNQNITKCDDSEVTNDVMDSLLPMSVAHVQFSCVPWTQLPPLLLDTSTRL